MYLLLLLVNITFSLRDHNKFSMQIVKQNDLANRLIRFNKLVSFDNLAQIVGSINDWLKLSRKELRFTHIIHFFDQVGFVLVRSTLKRREENR